MANNKKDQLEAILDEASDNAKKTSKTLYNNKNKSKTPETSSKSSGSNPPANKTAGSGGAAATASVTPTVNKSPPMVSLDILSQGLAGSFKDLGEGFNKSIMEMGKQLTGQFRS